jgi:pimeloyl-ACP methyl ester carboxylesterase
MNATVILVHGAFAESSSWSDVVKKVTGEHRVIAFANPLRSLAGDAAHLTELIKTIDGPIVLAGHSYGGAVITNVPADAGDIVGLVFVAAFATDAGESAGEASSLVPGATLAETIETVPLPDGGVDQYITQDKFRAQFCVDVPDETATLMAVTQRPITQAALSEPSTNDPLWRLVPSWFIFGDQDRNIPVGAPPDHGRAGEREEYPGDSWRIPRRRGLTRRGDGQDDPRSGALRGYRGGLSAYGRPNRELEERGTQAAIGEISIEEVRFAHGKLASPTDRRH